MIKIPLRSRKYPDLEAWIDDEDLDKIAGFKWSPYTRKISDVIYAVTTVRENGLSLSVRMHRLILPDTRMIDHINGNGLDNRKSNLRKASPTQNMANSRKRQGSTSRYKGVHWQTKASKWVAVIRYNRKHMYLGTFTDEIEAALTYDQAARQLFGEYARLNFPEGDLEWTLSVNSGLLVPQDHEDILQSRVLSP